MPKQEKRGMFHTADEVKTLMRLSNEVHKDRRPVPPNIAEKRKQIADAIRNAELFVAIFRVVDYGMINDITQMRLELDALYSAWIVEETPQLSDHKTLH